MSAALKVGDIVRRTGDPNAYAVGREPFKIMDFKIMDFKGVDSKFAIDMHGQLHSPQSLVLVESAEAVPSPEEYRDPRHEALIRTNEGLQATLRKRNEQIAVLQALGTPAAETADVLRELQKRTGEANAAKGFHAHGRTLRAREAMELKHDSFDGGESLHAAKCALADYYTARLALITTEVAEAIEELRHGCAVDETYYPTALTEDNARNIRDGLTPAELNLKPEGVPSELADVVIRSFDFAHEAGIDLAAIIEEKLAYNKTREHRHGKQF